MGWLQDAGAKVSNIGKDIYGGVQNIGDTLTGTSQNAGLLGVGQFKANPYDINQSVFTDTSKQEALKAQLAQQLAAGQGRAAPTMSSARLGAAPTSVAAQMNTAQTDQDRAQQQALAQQLQAQAAGQGPSLAQSQLQQATDRNISQGLAMQASQRGANAGQGLRNVAQGTAIANQQAAQQSADLRMQEQMAARNQLAGTLQGMRGQDIGVSQEQAQLQQQTGLANQAMAGQYGLGQAQLEQQAAANNQAAQLSQQQIGNQQAAGINAQMAGINAQEQAAAMAGQGLAAQQNLGVAGINSGAYQAASKARGDLIGGIGQGIAAGAMMNCGGKVPKYHMDGGGVVGDEQPGPEAMGATPMPNSMLSVLKPFADKLNQLQSKDKPEDSGQRKEGKSVGMGIGALLKPGAPQGDLMAGPDVSELPKTMVAATGGTVPGPPPPVPGDSPLNDRVPALLSVGEINLPREIVGDDKKILAFVHALRKTGQPATPAQSSMDAMIAKAMAFKTGRRSA